MKCEECLPLIEEYFDGELEGRTAESLAAHLALCAPCTGALTELEREQELYASYRRDIEVTPAQWNIVRARIEQEKDARPQGDQGTRRRGWLAELFGRQFRPAFVAALVLIVMGLAAGILYLNSGTRRGEIVSQASKQNETQAERRANEAVAPGKAESASVTASVEDKGKNDSAQQQQVAESRPRTPIKKNVAVASTTNSANVRGAQPTNDSVRFEAANFDRDSIVTGVRQSAPEIAGDFDFEVARHTERAQLLLRSFRNARPAKSGRAVDISYEKENARKLLYQNIALRRDAASRGDQPVAETLGTLEPILLDIAHLPDRATVRDVRSIEERMQKKEIVAALQVRTLVASN
ncbi:MAG TPA: zf-HC2 domain-containing protein [Pyrinomonadaceae bacterium]